MTKFYEDMLKMDFFTNILFCNITLLFKVSGWLSSHAAVCKIRLTEKIIYENVFGCYSLIYVYSIFSFLSNNYRATFSRKKYLSTSGNAAFNKKPPASSI